MRSLDGCFLLSSGVGSTVAEQADLSNESKDSEEGGDAEEDKKGNSNFVVLHKSLMLLVLVLGPSECSDVEDGQQQGDRENNRAANNRSEIIR